MPLLRKPKLTLTPPQPLMPPQPQPPPPLPMPLPLKLLLVLLPPPSPLPHRLVHASNRVVTHQSYTAAVVNGPAVAVNVSAETTSVVAASVAFPSSAATKLSKKIKLSAAVASPAAMADVTGNAFLPPSAQDLHTTTLKSPKKRDKIAAAVGHGATDASSVPASKS